jgi:hypothetical protein
VLFPKLNFHSKEEVASVCDTRQVDFQNPYDALNGHRCGCAKSDFEVLLDGGKPSLLDGNLSGHVLSTAVVNYGS